MDSQNYSELELNEYSSQLEHIDRECLQVQHSALERLKRFKADVDGHAKKKISAEQATLEVSQVADNCNRALDVILMTLQIRSLTLELKAAASISQNGLKYRLDLLKEDYSALQATFKDCFDPLSRVPQLDNWISFAEKKKQYELFTYNLLLQSEKKFAEVMHSKELQLGQLERTLEVTLKKKNQPLTLQVQVGDDGRLVAVEPWTEE